jgi:hypothetical protein
MNTIMKYLQIINFQKIFSKKKITFDIKYVCLFVRKKILSFTPCFIVLFETTHKCMCV